MKCIEDEIPFEVPDTWAWARISSISEEIFAGGDKPEKFSKEQNEEYPYAIYSNGIDKNGLYGFTDVPRVMKPSITISGRGTIGFSCVRYAPFFPIIRLITITPSSSILLEFLDFVFKRLLETGTGSSIPQLTVPMVKPKLIPIPPLKEQQKIVVTATGFFEQIKIIDEIGEDLLDTISIVKSKILDLAIRGKLVPQNPDDESASVLLERIRVEKEELIKQGKIKRDKKESVIFKGEDNSYYEKVSNGKIKCVDENIAFEIPDSWRWCRLGTLFAHNTGKALNSADTAGTPMTYITTSNLYWDRFELNSLKEMPFTESEIEKCTVTKGDLLVCEGGDIGRSAIWIFDEDIRIQNHIHRLRPYISLSNRFYFYVMFMWKQMGYIGGQGIGLQGFSSKALHNLLVPLPPAEEQAKIAAFVDNLFETIANIEQSIR